MIYVLIVTMYSLYSYNNLVETTRWASAVEATIPLESDNFENNVRLWVDFVRLECWISSLHVCGRSSGRMNVRVDRRRVLNEVTDRLGTTRKTRLRNWFSPRQVWEIRFCKCASVYISVYQCVPCFYQCALVFSSILWVGGILRKMVRWTQHEVRKCKYAGWSLLVILLLVMT